MIHTHEQFLKMSVGLSFGLVLVPLFRFSILCFFPLVQLRLFCSCVVCFFMAALHSRCGHYVFVLLLSFSFFSSPNLSSRRLNVYHT